MTNIKESVLMALLSRLVVVRWHTLFEWSVGFPGLFEAGLHVEQDVGMAIGDAVVFRNVVGGVVELFVLAIAKVPGATAEVGFFDVLPVWGTNGDNVFVIEEHELVVRRGCSGGEDVGDVSAVEFDSLGQGQTGQVTEGTTIVNITAT